MTTRLDFTIKGTCPVDGSADEYEVTLIRTGKSALPVEELLSFVAEATKEPALQEDITLALAFKFGGTVTTVGEHSGVRVTCCSDPNRDLR